MKASRRSPVQDHSMHKKDEHNSEKKNGEKEPYTYITIATGATLFTTG